MYFVSFQIYYLLSLTSIRDRHQLTTSETGLHLIIIGQSVGELHQMADVIRPSLVDTW